MLKAIRRLVGRSRLGPSLPPGLRLYAIGDVHGRHDLLEQLLDRIEDDHRARDTAGQAEVVLLGDLIDRGPASAAVVRRAMEGLSWATLHALKGNHEALMLDALDDGADKLRLWLRNGGDTALASWGVPPGLLDTADDDAIVAAARRCVPAAERAWLARRASTLERGDYLFVHAGIRPGVSLERQSPDDLLWIRDDFLLSARRHGRFVVHGHSITETVDERHNRIGIDTGAWRTDVLTALGLEGDQRWQVRTSRGTAVADG